ncbi:hypothetical protein E6W39_16275 [Kitasatospora acidiphila]|uniref:Uncharacterized protein n=1 Tax=Kitasatospora acidiphila TaxID=2567942 RepID=A0A540W3F0_9ACTN|nr:hypothetical protein [Kitasatospora acidiphila]TQF03502.1 hypothetical protein E6W39_16275 [Kitasatospora acidiphila]
MSVSDDPSAAAAALGVYRQARAAAVAPRPTPAWYPPARGILGGIAYIAAPFVFATDHPAIWLRALVIVAGVAFIAVHTAAVRPGGVLVMPKDHPYRKERLRGHLVSMLLWGASWLTAVPFGWQTGAVVSGLVLGGYLWFDSARERARAIRA